MRALVCYFSKKEKGWIHYLFEESIMEDIEEIYQQLDYEEGWLK